MFMAVMDTQIVNVALATITRDFHSTTSSSQWVITAYTLSLAVFVPASGWIGDRYGTKRTFVFATAIFTIASALCAGAPSLMALIVLRVLQGMGGALLTPVGLTMLYRAHAHHERVGAAKRVTLLTMLAPASAPLIGGVLVSALSWRWIFLVNVPFGLGLVGFAQKHLQEYRRPVADGCDLAGLLIAGPALALALYAVTDGPVAGWGAPRIWGSAIAGVGLLLWFARIELTRRSPMLDLRLLMQSALLRWATILQMLQPIAFVSCLVFTSLYIQESRGFSALTSGATTFSEAIAIAVTSGLVARLYPHLGPRRLVALGYALLLAGALILASMGGDTSLWVPRAASAVLGIGSSFVFMPLQASAFAQISEHDTSHASAITNAAGRIGSAAGVAIFTSVLTLSAGQTLRPAPSAFHPVFITAAGIATVGFALSWAIRDSDAANTMAQDNRPEPVEAVVA